MGFDITYTDFNSDETKILIYKGVEGGTVNDYVTRIEEDVLSYTYPTAQYKMATIGSITPSAGIGSASFLFAGSNITSESINWSGSSNWWFDFEINGVRQPLTRYNFQGVGTGPTVDVDDGYFTATSDALSTTTDLQIHIYDADGNNNFTLLNSVVAGRDVIRAYNYDMTPTEVTPDIEGLTCLKAKIGVLEATTHSFCGTDNPLIYTYYSPNKYSNIVASEIEINVLIKDSDDNDAMKNILDGGYYVTVYKNDVAKWFGKLTSRFYVEAYAQYPYAIKLSGSDQLGNFERYQPLMIDFPIPNAKTNLISLIGRFLMDDSMYDPEYAGDRIRTLYFSSRFSVDDISTLLSELYFDPLNWMEETTEYKSKKIILTDILKALHCKIFQWDYKWYIMDFEAQWDEGDVTWKKYYFDDSGESVGEASEVTDTADFISPHIADPTDRQVYNNAEMRYEPSWRKLEMNLNFNEREEDIDGFCNVAGNFYKGHDGVNLEFNDSDELRYWSGDNFIRAYGEDNSGWANIRRNSGEDLYQYINSSMPIYTYDEFNFKLTMLGVNGMKIPELRIVVSLTMGSDVYYLDNEDGDSADFVWNDNFRSITLIGNGDYDITLGLPFDTVTSNIILQVGIYSIPFPHGARGNAAIKGLKATFNVNGWETVDYKQQLEKWINPTEADTQITTMDYNWGLYHDTLPNDNYFHRSGVYYDDGTLVSKFDRDGKTGTLYLMDWIGNIMIADNNTYTNTLTASYFSQLTPLSLMVDAEGKVYRFVSGQFEDKISTWRNVYTEFKGIEGIAAVSVRGDASALEYNDDYYIDDTEYI